MPGLRWLELGLFAGFLRRQLAGERFDGAVIYSDGAAFAASALQAKTHLLVYHHGSMRRTCRDGAAWRRCRHIVAVSCYQAAALKAFRPRYAHKIAAIPNLLDGVWVQQAAGAFSPGFAPGKFHIVTCARLHRDKGVDLAVDACARLGHLKDLHWWVLGGGPEEGTLRSRIRALGLEERMNFFPNQLSGGQCQRVAIARAMVGKPDLLLADEPTGALDTKAGSQIMDIFKRLSEEGMTIIMITHEPAIARCANKTYRILDGELYTGEGGGGDEG